MSSSVPDEVLDPEHINIVSSSHRVADQFSAEVGAGDRFHLSLSQIKVQTLTSGVDLASFIVGPHSEDLGNDLWKSSVTLTEASGRLSVIGFSGDIDLKTPPIRCRYLSSASGHWTNELYETWFDGWLLLLSDDTI